MTSLALHGLRGGLGRSSVLAALGHALRELGERVLLVDLCSNNLLGLHFNLPLVGCDGWANAERDGRPFGDQVFEVFDGLCVMPFGELDEPALAELSGTFNPGIWSARQAQLVRHFDWVLFDLPSSGALREVEVDVRVLVAEAEMTSHILLERQAPERFDLLLINRFDAASRLQSDVLMVWRRLYHNRLPLQVIHRDEAFVEALACKAPVGHYAPQSLASRDVQSLAVRCLTRRRS
ncbi:MULTISPECIES: cellulose biosynthesis protein BcsQ [Pseudomonas]|uniref:Cellulose synthase operon protein YhjQ n=3 Tax=Gammaproteobacteria TaxID=1236 RepID=A0AAX0W0A9_9PSED|nr:MULTISPECIES: cellulose biosynthesis protein BcsQ [Pseudomonas]MBF8754054.1 cellulose synthase operon protein YhjQ [Pseudomonas guariconensis]MBH3357619.1 cellulose synthase operon protein YhjQ [Pseudomonas guariconensis]MCO7622810.1 cellulose biosynthesis protein BcsQ [Pseudomonas guariconensis]MDM9591891.1 cellulose biosynthesis protein BcsQ [Pseudomonas guariconensis]MDM9604718.1 cellulose biosynthesis protein BcsQ [Pseudomonas guariconensis]